jgi:hypothetical protein
MAALGAATAKLAFLDSRDFRPAMTEVGVMTEVAEAVT